MSYESSYWSDNDRIFIKKRDIHSIFMYDKIISCIVFVSSFDFENELQENTTFSILLIPTWILYFK